MRIEDAEQSTLPAVQTVSYKAKILPTMEVQQVQIFRLDVRSQFDGLTSREQRYAHHMARLVRDRDHYPTDDLLLTYSNLEQHGTEQELLCGKCHRSLYQSLISSLNYTNLAVANGIDW